jgi:signal transduction histidine kinase
MLESTDLQPQRTADDGLLMLMLDRNGEIQHVSAALARLAGEALQPGRSLGAGGVVLGEAQQRALLASAGHWSGKASLLRGENPPIGATLMAMSDGEDLRVLVSVDVDELLALQDALSGINSQLTNLNRERTKAQVRLARALQDVEEKNQQLQALNEELQALNEELESQTEALHEAHDQADLLSQQNRELHQLDELKNQFIGIVSHELKTPLNFVMGFTSVLADEVLGPLNERQIEAMEKVLTGAQRLDLLINELLDANKLQAGKLDVCTEPVDLPALLGEVLAEVRPLHAAKQLTLSPPADCPPRVWADPVRLHQVLRNLISNAIKFTPPGGAITLSATPYDGPAGPRVRVSVADTGIGIPHEAQALLFQPFFQVDSTNTRKFGGTGLGLSIVKSLVELMDGEVDVESTPGAGSTFGFTLPVEAPVAP